MKKMLIIDIGREFREGWAKNLSGSKSTIVLKSNRFLDGRFDELVVVDYGCERSEALVALAIAYRVEHRHCRVSINRVLGDDWSETESMSRVNSHPTIVPGDSYVNVSDIPKLLNNVSERVGVKFTPDAVQFEYAA